MLKKLELMQSGLAKLVEDEEIQQEVFGDMQGHLSVYTETYHLQKEITDLQEEAAEMAKAAIDFEKYVGNYLGSLQGFISEVVRIDQNLSAALEEIKDLTDIIMSESGFFINNDKDLSKWLMSLLTQSTLKQDRLPNALEDMEKQTLSAIEMEIQILLNSAESNSVTETLAKIQLHLQPIFTQLLQFNSTKQTPENYVEYLGLQFNSTKQTPENYVEYLGLSVNLEMVAIKEGTFLMGSPRTELESSNRERPQHQVTVSAFLMSKYPVTQAQWRAVAALPQVNRELNPELSNFKGANRPVECVSWYDAVEFCDRLSSHTKRQYRLPSEAEWEYACRAETTTPFHFGETITTDVANYRGTDNEEYKWSGFNERGSKGIYREKTTEVGSFGIANAFGLYDMHGNVWEWCLDDWHIDYEGAPKDGSPWLDNNNNLYQKKGYAVLRGGSWFYNPLYCRSAYRLNNIRSSYGLNFGFRVVCGVGRIIC